MVQQESVVRVAKPISHEDDEEIIIAKGLYSYVVVLYVVFWTLNHWETSLFKPYK